MPKVQQRVVNALTHQCNGWDVSVAETLATAFRSFPRRSLRPYFKVSLLEVDSLGVIARLFQFIVVDLCYFDLDEDFSLQK